MTKSSPWLRVLGVGSVRAVDTGARLRLICFAHAGGGASSFAQWPRWLTVPAEICAVQLPGREDRWREPPLTALSELIDPLCLALLPQCASPCVLFGHSLGALLAFEVARQWQRMGAAPPCALLISGHSAPHLPSTHPSISHLPAAEFWQAVAGYGGLPDELLAEAELCQLLLPALRADFALGEGYRFQPGPPLTCPLLVVGGAADGHATPDQLAEWRQHTQGAFAQHSLAGGHFYLHEQRATFFTLLNHVLAGLVTK